MSGQIPFFLLFLQCLIISLIILSPRVYISTSPSLERQTVVASHFFLSVKWDYVENLTFFIDQFIQCNNNVEDLK